MRVVSIVNQKGGCGKTTTAVNLAAILARDGARVLLVDMDPQSHCAAGLGVPDLTLERTIADAMLADHAHPPRADEYLWEVGHGLKLVPSSVALASLEAPNGPLAARFDRDRRLARVLGAWQHEFDWCIIDCPPTIGLLTFNALRASDLVLIPVETGYFSLKGAEKQIETIRSIVRRFGRDIPFALLPTLYNESRALSRDVVATLAKRFPEYLLPIMIREHEELRDAASYGQSIMEFAPGSAAEADFALLAAWLAENAPAATALADFGAAEPPLMDIPRNVALPGFDLSLDEAAAFGSVGESTSVGSSTKSSAHSTTDATLDRAADLVSRLRALADRARSPVPFGGGFGVRADREGVVIFSQPATAHGLFVVGDFNGWNPVATPLMASSDGMRMEASVELSPGRHAYRIAVDGLEMLDPHNTHREAEEGTIGVSLVEVPHGAGQSMPARMSEGRSR